jgi:magnesium transporter
LPSDAGAGGGAASAAARAVAPTAPAGSAPVPTDTPITDFPTTATEPATPRPTAPGPPARDRVPPGDTDRIRVSEYRDGKLREWRGFDNLSDACRRTDNTLWIDMVDPSPEQVAEIAHLLGLHPLVAEDILEGNQRAKIETTDRLVHIVMFSLTYDGEMVTSEIDFVLGDHYLLTVHEPRWDPRQTVHLREGLEPIIKRGPDHLLWALVDALVDSYFPFIDRMGDEVDALEDEVVERASPEVLDRLFHLKRDLITARRAAAPIREIFNQLTNRDLALIDHDEVIYFRDVYDHLIRLTDELDSYRELVSGALDVYLSTVNNNLSVIMKRLTGVTVILAGIGAIAGIFGMSEATTAFSGGEGTGFWLVAGLTVTISVFFWWLLRRRGYI